jgi:hypothetical protein
MIESIMTLSSRRHLASSPFPPAAEIDHPIYAVGDRVCHDTFGLGRVISVESTVAVSIDFGSFTQWVPLPASRLFPL